MNGNPFGQLPPELGGYGNLPNTADPAFQPPGEPLRDLSLARVRARVIYREIPNVVVQTGWQVADVRSALLDLVVGRFDRPAQLLDAIAGDSRVQSAMRSRSGGLLGRPIRFSVPRRLRHDPDAKKCKRVWENHWLKMAAEPALLQLLETGHTLGFSYCQILWDTERSIWKPYLQDFGARYSYYHWVWRLHMAITLDGQFPVNGGDGHWVLHAPYGTYRGWMRGALRALAQWWLARSYALRDWARYCERHGFPILLADTPFGADPGDIAQYQLALQSMGQETVLQLPGSVDTSKYGKYDLRYLEPQDENWQAFKSLIEQCNDEITLALLGQNLTSQVKEGSLAAARVHADVRQAILEADARALAKTLYVQVVRPFAALNFGNPNLAPHIEWDVSPPEDYQVRATTLASFASAVSQFRQAGFQVEDVERFARKFGLRGLRLAEVPPVQIEAQLARATGKDEESAKKKKADEEAQEAKLAAFQGTLLGQLDKRLSTWNRDYTEVVRRSTDRAVEVCADAIARVDRQIEGAAEDVRRSVERSGEVLAHTEAAGRQVGEIVAAFERTCSAAVREIGQVAASVERSGQKAESDMGRQLQLFDQTAARAEQSLERAAAACQAADQTHAGAVQLATSFQASAERARGELESAADRAAERLASGASDLRAEVQAAVVETKAARTPPRQPPVPFAHRSAALLADIREQRELGFEPDIAKLAKLHKVPIPTAK